MSIDVSNVSVGGSLAISVSGTDYLQRSKAAGVLPGSLPHTELQKSVTAGRETVASALKKVSAETIAAIESALKSANPSASLTTYTPGAGWKNPAGTFFTLEA